MEYPDNNCIVIKGARVNNLKNISLKIPRNKLVVITGVSGSGKSSLAFETLFAEGQRRFAESLSSFARQFLGRMGKPSVDYIEGIPPAIAIEQRVNSRNPRSTVGTVTETYDYLRLLFAKIGRTYSPVSGREVKRETVRDVVDYICSFYRETEDNTKKIIYITASFGWEDKETRTEKLLNLRDSGFTRLYRGSSPDNLNSEESKRQRRVVKIDDVLKGADSYYESDLKVLVDRFAVIGGISEVNGASEEEIARMQDSVQTAFNEGDGFLQIIIEDSANQEKELIRNFSNLFEADGILFEEPNEFMFSYNNPMGACPKCGGFGSIEGIDESLVVPNASLSVYEGAIACWRGEIMGEYLKQLIYNAAKFDFPIHKPYASLTKEQKQLLWNGNSYFTGIFDFFKIVEKQRYKIQFKYMLARYSGKTKCPECDGNRLKKETEYVKIGGKTISELMNMSITALLDYFNTLTLNPHDMEIAGRALKEIKLRLNYICEVGLGYLTLNRAANTLSGGESQRMHLVGSLGNSLVGSLYILDEPSVGLHPRDTERMIGVLKSLRDLGNTVIIVEHDMEIIRSADYLIDIGPYAGLHGGEVVFDGSLKEALKQKEAGNSQTIAYLNGIKRVTSCYQKRRWHNYIEIDGCMEHNLKNIDVKIPLGVLTVITGVSGSGKSSLVSDLLYPALSRYFNQFGEKPGSYKEIKGDLSLLRGIEYVDQNPIGKSSRSNPVTYLKIYDDIRKLFSDQPYAKMNGYGHSHFSFNIDGGRCPQCLGDGFITIPMQFMADVTMVCDECGGKRFKPDILEVKYNGKNISDILDMSIDEAIDFFGSKRESIAKRIAEKMKILQDVGLGYIQLGQSSSTLSGGESQRIKLAQFLSKGNPNGSVMFIFDEPTTGLHLNDIEKLMKSLNALIERGHTVVVVEHNTDVIRSADWVIDMGPEGGDKGGEIVFEGTPEELSRMKDNYTGKALATSLSY
jgi:excinuclease ABC subunit A